jgi:hypothetical protein
MEYSKIVAITGLPGLFELVSSKTDGAIVRSLDDKSTRFVSTRIHNFSHLESIEVFTSEENVNLAEVLKAMEGGSEKLPDEKDSAALTSYFKKVYPKLDFDRVYNSDLRKMVKWFSVLKNNQVDFTEVAAPEVPEEPKTVEEKPVPVKTEAPVAAEKPAKKKKEKAPPKEVPEKKTEKKPAKAKPAKKEVKEVKEKAVKKDKPAKKAAKKKK